MKFGQDFKETLATQGTLNPRILASPTPYTSWNVSP
jgi:hypothetical protein